MIDNDFESLKISEIFGAEEEPLLQRLTLYIPNKDKKGKEIKNLEYWVKEARKILTKIGRGSTTFPPSDGTWLPIDEYIEENIIWEKTIIIYTIIDPDLFKNNAIELRGFLHKFGKETNQGEVVFEFDGELYK